LGVGNCGFALERNRFAAKFSRRALRQVRGLARYWAARSSTASASRLVSQHDHASGAPALIAAAMRSSCGA
jgi:hypothetical protein